LVSNPPHPSGSRIIAYGVMIELLLGLCGLVLCFLTGKWPTWDISLDSTAIGVFAGLLLFLLIWLLAKFVEGRTDPASLQILELRENFAKPLAEALSLSQALLLASMAGLSEEFFFRGALESSLQEAQPLAALFSGMLFVVMHFGRRTLEWRFVSCLYLLVSLAFSVLLFWSNSLWATALSHAVYDLLALRNLKNRPNI